jgi:opacity protein-like surface antigen
MFYPGGETMKTTAWKSRLIIFSLIFSLGVPALFAENSVGLRLGYNFFTGDREDDFIFGTAFNLEYDPQNQTYTFVSSSLPGPMDMDASAIFFGGEGNFVLPMFGDRFIFSPVFEYYRKNNVNYLINAASLQWQGVEPDILTHIDSDRVDYGLFSIMANMKYLLLDKEQYSIVPYVGGGLGLHYWSIDVERVYFGGIVDYQAPDIIPIDTTNYTETDSDQGWSFGAQLLGGVGANVHPQIEPFAELTYRFMQRAEARIFRGGIDEEIFKANFNGLQVLLGIRFKF